tara:strand:+ start:27204 stop:28154 length:951 start_codon:yes stop_codon:yes gene_type:complete
MNTKSIAALVVLVAGTGVVAAVWSMTRDEDNQTPVVVAPPPVAPTPLPELSTVSFTPGPASVFLKSAGGQPMPAQSRSMMQGMMGMMASLIGRMEEFDANGDGLLSDLEKIAMGFKLRKEFLADHDLDGDGEMSGEEWRAFQRSMFEQTPEGQQLMKQFDADGDGVLDEDEQAALDAHLDQREQDRRAKERARMDTDGDGDVSREERRAAQQQEQAFWQNQMNAAETNFDYDEDGELNIEESRDAWDAWVEYQIVDDFITRYDTNGDRRMETDDYNQFLNDYGQRDPSSDVNGDGEIDIEDVYAFHDLMQRSMTAD